MSFWGEVSAGECTNFVSNLWVAYLICDSIGYSSRRVTCEEVSLKVGISGYGNFRTMSTDKWATSKSIQLSTKIWVKLLLLLEMP